MHHTPRLEGMDAATANMTGWRETQAADGSPRLFYGDPAGAFKPLDPGWSSSVKRLWWCRPCETTWVD
jgi:hypothetical protein